MAVPQAGQNHAAPFPAAYSSNIFVDGFPFGDRRIGFGDTRAGGDTEIERFAPAAVPGSYQAVLPDRTRVELIAAADGSLQYYRHRDPTGSHVLEISFSPPPLRRTALQLASMLPTASPLTASGIYSPGPFT